VADPPDVVYVVRPGENNLALRFSLRSLANLPHGRVFVAGHCPSWVRNITAIPVRKLPSKLNTIENNIKVALKHPELGERCVYFNDDFYVMEPIDEVPITHGGPVSGYKGRQEFKWRMARTVDEFTRQRLQPLNGEMMTYDGVHMPLPLETEVARQCLGAIPSGVLWRTWYGNVCKIGGVQVSNTKSQKGELVPGPFLSTNATTLHALKRHLDDVLPKGGPYV
jgi:hypothetical protein